MHHMSSWISWKAAGGRASLCSLHLSDFAVPEDLGYLPGARGSSEFKQLANQAKRRPNHHNKVSRCP